MWERLKNLRIGDKWFRKFLVKWFVIGTTFVVCTLSVITGITRTPFFIYSFSLNIFLLLPLICIAIRKYEPATYLHFGSLTVMILLVAYIERTAGVLDALMLIFIAAGIIGYAIFVHILFLSSVSVVLIFVALDRLTFGFNFGPDGLPGANTVLFSLPMMIMGYVIAIVVDKILIRTIREQESQIFVMNQLQAQLVLREKLASIGELAGSIAHEINNPLTGIINYVDLILDKEHGDPSITPGSETYDFMAEIRNESLRISRITRNLLTFSRNRDGNEPETVNLLDTLDLTISLVQYLFRKDGIALKRTYLDYRGNALVYAPIGELQQLFLGILRNARTSLNRKFPPEGLIPELGKKIVEVKLELISDSAEIGSVMPMNEDYSQNPLFLRISFFDNGIGLDEEIVQRLFEPLYTTKRLLENSPQTHELHGIGLDLATGQKLIHELGGRITIDTKKGNFFQINIDLPLV